MKHHRNCISTRTYLVYDIVLLIAFGNVGDTGWDFGCYVKQLKHPRYPNVKKYDKQYFMPFNYLVLVCCRVLTINIAVIVFNWRQSINQSINQWPNSNNWTYQLRIQWPGFNKWTYQRRIQWLNFNKWTYQRRI